jgi:hypothetical protein
MNLFVTRSALGSLVQETDRIQLLNIIVLERSIAI